MDAKLKSILTKLNAISNVASSRDTSQQGGEGGVFLEVNINFPYQTSPMEKNTENIHLEMRTLEENLKNLKEKKLDKRVM